MLQGWTLWHGVTLLQVTRLLHTGLQALCDTPPPRLPSSLSPPLHAVAGSCSCGGAVPLS